MKEPKIFNERNLTEKVHYVYRVTIDEHYYIGKRTGFLNDLETGRYRTSSKLVHEKLKNGMTFSKIKILQVFSTEKDALKFEERILTRLNVRTNPKFLNQTNGNKDFYFKQHTEKTKEKISKTKKAQFDENTEQGRKLREKMSKSQKTQFDKNTEYGRKLREIRSEIKKAQFDENTEQGRKRRKHISNKRKEYFNPETEQGIRNRENLSKIKRKFFNSEQGRKRSKNHSEFMKENGKNITQKSAKTRIQKRKNISILGELMFNKEFIKENFLITDDKNNQRFLSSVYSKLTGYSRSHICLEKGEGKLRFLHGIKSISLTEELENSKIREIECFLKEAYSRIFN